MNTFEALKQIELESADKYPIGNLDNTKNKLVLVDIGELPKIEPIIDSVETKLNIVNKEMSKQIEESYTLMKLRIRGQESKEYSNIEKNLKGLKENISIVLNAMNIELEASKLDDKLFNGVLDKVIESYNSVFEFYKSSLEKALLLLKTAYYSGSSFDFEQARLFLNHLELGDIIESDYSEFIDSLVDYPNEKENFSSKVNFLKGLRGYFERYKEYTISSYLDTQVLDNVAFKVNPLDKTKLEIEEIETQKIDLKTTIEKSYEEFETISEEERDVLVSAFITSIKAITFEGFNPPHSNLIEVSNDNLDLVEEETHVAPMTRNLTPRPTLEIEGNVVKALVESSPDFFQHLFDVIFIWSGKEGGVLNKIGKTISDYQETIKIASARFVSVTIPQSSTNTFETKFLGTEITRASSVVENPYQSSLVIDLDERLTFVDSTLKLAGFKIIGEKGYHPIATVLNKSKKSKDEIFHIIVRNLSTSVIDSQSMFVFEDVKLLGISNALSIDTTSANPQTVSIPFIYKRCYTLTDDLSPEKPKTLRVSRVDTKEESKEE